jgi:hypothetical protein
MFWTALGLRLLLAWAVFGAELGAWRCDIKGVVLGPVAPVWEV